MLWIPKSEIDYDKLRSELTVATLDFNGNPEDLIKLYEDAGEYVGVPRKWGIQKYPWLDVEDNTTLPYIEWPSIKFPEGWKYWPGQKESITSVIDHFNKGRLDTCGALLEAPCGGGKTLMATSVASMLNTPTLVLVHKGDLAKQWRDLCHGTDKTPGLFPDIKFGHVQRDQCDYEGCHMVTAMAQTIFSRQATLPPSFFNYFGLIIYDEGHRYPARTFEKVMCLPTAKYRLGISATWRRADELECIWNWHVGSVVARAKVVRLSGNYAQIPFNTALSDTMMKQRYGNKIDRNKWITSITSNTAYNHWLSDQIISAHSVGRTILLVSDRVQHCKDLQSMIVKKAAKKGLVIAVGLYLGKMKEEQLEASKKRSIILATYSKMSEGTDIPKLDTLFLSTPRTDIEQVVGRIQRVVEGKKPLLVVDPVFTSSYNTRMALKRKKVYERLGFNEQKVGK